MEEGRKISIVVYDSAWIYRYGGGVVWAFNKETGELKPIPLDKVPQLEKKLLTVDAVAEVLANTQELRGAEELRSYAGKLLVAALEHVKADLAAEVVPVMA